jgi:DNA-binding response OmpR family regulator
VPKKRDEPLREATIAGISVRLPQREYDLLRVLQHRKGVPIDAAALEQEVAGIYVYPSASSKAGQGARDLVSHLRDRLIHAGLPGHRLICNAQGRGYYWVEPDQEAES